MSKRRLIAAADIGGTFTDLVLIDADSGETVNVKVLTTPADPTEGVMEALREGLETIKAGANGIERFAHATTLPTNLVLERKGARVAFVTTHGFGDMFAISRQHPSGPDCFNLRWERPPALAQRDLTVEVMERMSPAGQVLKPLDEDQLRDDLRALAPRRPEAFAVCLYHSYVNAAHEQRVGEIIAEQYPDAMVSLSSEVWPEFREYERASATVLSAYVGPVFGTYVERLGHALKELGVPAPLQIMQSSGSIMSAAEATRRAAYAIESGPAAGVIAAADVGRSCGRSDVISFDMGGTTAKAGLVLDGRPGLAHEFRVGGQASSSGQREAGEPIRIPVIDLAEVGAGGGSIAWIDAGGHLKLGPRSAGADPGPACYGRGGTEPTVTDANLILGYLDANYFNGGKMTISPELARAAIEEKVARPLGISVVEAARGIHSLANAVMGAAIRMVTLQRGVDPREHAIIAFGGAGPLHIVHLAESFDIPEVIVPASPGVKSAYGLLVSDLAYDTVRTLMSPIEGADLDRLTEALETLSTRAVEVIAKQETGGGTAHVERALDIAFSYKFQSSPIVIPDGPISAETLAQAEQDYRAEQQRVFGVESTDKCRIMGVRVRASVPHEPWARHQIPAASGKAQEAIKAHRDVWFAMPGDFVATPVFDRARLRAGHRFEGPAIVEEPDATTVCPPGCSVRVDDELNLVIRVAAGNPGSAGQDRTAMGAAVREQA